MVITTNLKNIFIENTILKLDKLIAKNHINNAIQIYKENCEKIKGYCDLNYIQVKDGKNIIIPKCDDDNYIYNLYKVKDIDNNFFYQLLKELKNENINYNTDYYFDIDCFFDNQYINENVENKQIILNDIINSNYNGYNILTLNKINNEMYRLDKYIPKDNLVIPVIFNVPMFNENYNGVDKVYNEYDYNKFMYKKRCDDIINLDIDIRNNYKPQNYKKLYQPYPLSHYQQIKEAIEDGNFFRSIGKLINIYILCGEEYILQYLKLNILSMKFNSYKYKYEENISEEQRRLIKGRKFEYDSEGKWWKPIKITTTYFNRKREVKYAFNERELCCGILYTKKQFDKYLMDREQRKEQEIIDMDNRRQPIIIKTIDEYN